MMRDRLLAHGSRGRGAVLAAGLALALLSGRWPGQAIAASRTALEVRRALLEWQVDRAAELVERLRRESPESAQLAELTGHVRFYQGAYAEAVQLLQRAMRQHASPPRWLRETQQLVADTAATVEGFVEHRSDRGHFRFKVRRGKDELLIPFAGRALEAMRERLHDDLGYAPPDPIRVEVYAEPSDLARVSPLTVAEIERTGTVALSKYNRLMIVSPRALPRGYGWLDTLAHEYVHLVVGRLSRNRAPVWLQEGLAKHLESRWRSGTPGLSPAEEHLLASAVRGKRRLVRWSEMHPSMARLPDQETVALAFAQVQTAIAFLIQHHQHAGVRQLLTAIRSGRAAWAAVHQVTGLDRTRFQRELDRHLRRLKLRLMPGLVPPRRRFGKQPTEEQRVAGIREDRARRFFRLADMLRQRRLTRAAIVEYRKARALVGERDALVSNALGRAYLELGSHDQAIDTLLPVLEYYPEVPSAQVTVATAYLLAGNLDAASRHFTVALRINPFDPQIHCGLARALEPGSSDAALHQRLCGELTAAR